MEQQPELCMFCGKDESFGLMSREHFVPKCLWNDGTRPQHTKTVPAHKKCNSSFSEVNEYFRDVLVSEEGAAQHPEVQKLLAGKIDRKFQNRPGSMLKVLKDMQYRPISTAGGVITHSAPTFEVDESKLRIVLLNVIKGIYYATQERPLPQEWLYLILSGDALTQAQVKPWVDNLSPWCDFGDDVFRCRYTFEKRGGIFAVMQFYRHRGFIGWAVSEHYIRSGISDYLNSLVIDNST